MGGSLGQLQASKRSKGSGWKGACTAVIRLLLSSLIAARWAMSPEMVFPGDRIFTSRNPSWNSPGG